MIRHIVMYVLREDCNHESAIAEIRSALEPLTEVIPGLLTMEIRPSMGGRFDYVLYSEFEDIDSLEGYKTHPAHMTVKPTVHGYITERVSSDCIV